MELDDTLYECFNSPSHSDVLFQVISSSSKNVLGEFHAHKPILSARSAYFRCVFELKDTENYIDDLSLQYEMDQERNAFTFKIYDVETSVLHSILEFMYTNRLRHIPFDIPALRSFYLIARKFQLKIFESNGPIPKIAEKKSTAELWLDISNLHNTNMLADVVLVVEGKSFYAHKSILTARSQYFAGLLRSDWKESKQQEIVLHDICAESFEILLDYIYTNSIDIGDISNILELFKLAQFFGVNSLTRQCESTISETRIDSDSVCPLWNISQHLNAEILKECCQLYFIYHFKQCVQSPNFYSLDFALLKNALNSGDIDEDDDIMFRAINEYVRNYAKDNQQAQDLLTELLPPSTLFNKRVRLSILAPAVYWRTTLPLHMMTLN